MNYRLLAAALLLGCAGSPSAAPIVGQVLSLDSPDQWLLAADPANAGKQQKWWSAPRADAKPARVPSTIQETLGEYHGTRMVSPRQLAEILGL